MYDELQKIISPYTLSPFEFEKIEELLKEHTEDEILNAYRQVGYKPINYIKKVLSKNIIAPSWLNKEILNKPIDKEAEETFNDFQDFIKEFRNE